MTESLPHFISTFEVIWVNCVTFDAWGGGDYNIGANQAGKRAHSLFNFISVADSIKINEQTNR